MCGKAGHSFLHLVHTSHETLHWLVWTKNSHKWFLCSQFCLHGIFNCHCTYCGASWSLWSLPQREFWRTQHQGFLPRDKAQPGVFLQNLKHITRLSLPQQGSEPILIAYGSSRCMTRAAKARMAYWPQKGYKYNWGCCGITMDSEHFFCGGTF